MMKGDFTPRTEIGIKEKNWIVNYSPFHVYSLDLPTPATITYDGEDIPDRYMLKKLAGLFDGAFDIERNGEHYRIELKRGRIKYLKGKITYKRTNAIKWN